MSRTVNLSIILFAFFLEIVLGKGVSAVDQDVGRIKVFVSIEPQAFFVERVGGPYVEVKVLVGPGRSPATYDPTPRQMAELAQAQVLFRIGVPFEQRLLEKISSTFKSLEVVDTREAIALRPLGENSSGGGKPDPHVWLDPKLVKIQAETICRTLSRIDPAHAAQYERNLRSFQRELDELASWIDSLLAPFRGEAIYVFHPAYGYFASAFGLRQVAVETGGREPMARELTSLIRRMKKLSVRVIFVQPQFAATAAHALERALDCRLVTLDPLARDYLVNLKEMARKVAEALRSSKQRVVQY